MRNPSVDKRRDWRTKTCVSSATPRGARGNLGGRRCEGAEEGDDQSGKTAKRGRRGFEAVYRNKLLPPRK